MSKKVQVTIGDVSIAIEGEVPQNTWETARAYGPFVGAGKTDITLRLHQGLPDSVVGEKVFDCPPIWTLYRQNGMSIIKIFHKLSGLERTLVLQDNFEKADLYFADKAGRAGKAGRFDDPFYGPTMELLMVNYLATKGMGVIVHSCGIAMNGTGMLFVGESRAGKSTLAMMWNEEDGVEVLSDDRTIVRKKGQEFWMCGTPWHGEAKFGSPRGVRLERIFFIRHGRKNSIKEVKGTDPVSQLLTCSFPPYWDMHGMAFTMELFTDLTARIPCQELTFTPDQTALELIKSITT